MSLFGLYIFLGGIVVSVLSFLFALINMGSVMTSGRRMESLFAGHLGAMGGMAIGGLVTVIGIIVLIMDAIQTYAH